MPKALGQAYEAPWVTFDPIMERFVCGRCRHAQPVASRSAEGLVVVGSTFLRTHAACLAPGAPDEDESDLFEGEGAAE